jgi:hypothetical protein
LPSAEAADFLGTWNLTLDLQGNSVPMTLDLSDSGGMLAAALTSARRPEPIAITTARREGEALELSWSQDRQGQAMEMKLSLLRSDAGVSGTFGDSAGMFSADVTGTLAGGAVAAETATSDAAGGDGDDNSDGAGRRRRPGGAVATLSLDGKNIRIAYEPLKQDSVDYQALEALGKDQVFSFIGGRAIKLLTEVHLKFGHTVVKQGNVADNYPGVYSLWLKQGDDGLWKLVFNSDADIWGTQRLPEADVAEIPFRHSAAPTPNEALTIELEGVGESGLLRLVWGNHQWVAPFDVAQ